MTESAIEWTDATWNPIRARYEQIQHDGSSKTRIGWHCEHVSKGCRFCYAEGFNLRLGTGRIYSPDELRGTTRHHHRNGKLELFLDEKTLGQPLHWKRPRKIFLGSMTDIFARFVPDEWLDRIFGVMALAQQHTFQVLTKRPERMLAYTQARKDAMGYIYHASDDFLGTDHGVPEEYPWEFPFPNVWLGVSVEDQSTAHARIPLLLKTPAALRFISAEPLLGPLDLRNYLTGQEDNGVDLTREVGSKVGACIGWTPPLDWVIAGGESGPHARPMHPDWPRALRDQCAAAVFFFFKQWGEWMPIESWEPWDRTPQTAIRVYGTQMPDEEWHEDGQRFKRVGKARAGNLLDGVAHQEFPE